LPRAFGEPCAFNVFSHNSTVDAESGLNTEEQKLIDETRKIWRDSSVLVSPTCIRVPVVRAHSESVTLELNAAASEAEVREVLSSGEGIHVIDDRASNRFPTPLKASGRDEVLVGRIRRDPGAKPEPDGRSRGWQLFLCGDQLRKGAALNAVQIAQILGAAKTGPPRLHGGPTAAAGHRMSRGTPAPIAGAAEASQSRTAAPAADR
jgi:aspartate-semialdehyde dehydrogenase